MTDRQRNRRQSSSVPTRRRSSRSRVDFDKGKVLMLLAKTTYTTLERVVIECVQNALDAEARQIWLAIDVDKGTIVVADDGEGVSREDFEVALRSVGMGVKDASKLGRFGLGLISPLDKCHHFTFTSKPRAGGPRLQWTFNARDLEIQTDRLSIPVREVSDPGDEWSTKLMINGITRDRHTGNLDPHLISEGVQEKLGPAMRKSGVTCILLFRHANGQEERLEIKPTQFGGDAFNVVAYDEEDAGVVEFELYRAVRTSQGRAGHVVFSELDSLYPVTWREFVRQNRDLLSKEVMDALGSGFFEGVIRAKNIELHPSRNKFTRNDALLGLCATIEQWFDETGRQLYLDERVEEQERRLQELGFRSLERLKDLLHLPQFEHLLNVLREMPYGTQGSGHVEAGKDTGKTTEPGIRTGQGGAGKKRKPSNGEPREGKGSGETRPGDFPFVSTGPDGKERKLVRKDSSSLVFVHSPLEGSDRLWEFDDTEGVIYFNIRHPVWVMCDKKDHHILQLQEWIALQAIHLLLEPKDAWPALRGYSDRMAKPYAELVILTGHKRTKKS